MKSLTIAEPVMAGCGRGRRAAPPGDVWDVEGGYMGMKKQKLLQQFSVQVRRFYCTALPNPSY